MTDRTPETRIAVRQLPLYLPATAAPHLDDARREAVIQLLALLLTSACTHAEEARDETR